jgi:hypothetical protein
MADVDGMKLAELRILSDEKLEKGDAILRSVTCSGILLCWFLKSQSKGKYPELILPMAFLCYSFGLSIVQHFLIGLDLRRPLKKRIKKGSLSETTTLKILMDADITKFRIIYLKCLFVLGAYLMILLYIQGTW